MKCFYDTEFLEDGETIALISIGMTAEPSDERGDLNEYYAVNADASWGRIEKHDWLMANVVPSLPLRRGAGGLVSGQPLIEQIDFEHPTVKTRDEIAQEVAEYLQRIPNVELWAYYGAYDHVALSQLWGPMVKHPAGVPMWTNDIKQEWLRLGRPALPEQAEGLHNALADARHNAVMAQVLATANWDQLNEMRGTAPRPYAEPW